MFSVFSRAKTSEARSRDILLQFAYAPIAVGLIATVLGLVVGAMKSGFDNGNFWTAMTMSLSILIAGVAILIYRWWGKSGEDTGTPK